MTERGREWADYSSYDTETSNGSPHCRAFPVTIAATEFYASALSICGTTLAVELPLDATMRGTLPADEPVTLRTPEETVTVRLCSVAFGFDRLTLSFERFDE